MSTTSRRAILAGAATLPALAVPAVAGSLTPDPIFAAIERHRAAYEEHGRVLEAVNAEEDPETHWTNDERVAAACDADCDALRALVQTVPATFAGAAAMLRYLVEHQNMGNDTFRVFMYEDEDYHLTGDALLGTMVEFLEARS